MNSNCIQKTIQNTNLKNIRERIISGEFDTRIHKIAEKLKVFPYTIKEELISNDITTLCFTGSIESEKRKNLYRKQFEENLRQIPEIERLCSYYNNKYIFQGNISNRRKDTLASNIHFGFEYLGEEIYCMQIHTDGSGGSQTNQYLKVIRFIRNCKANQKYKFLVLCDGDYYDDIKIKELNNDYCNSQIQVIRIADYLAKFQNYPNGR